MPKLYQPNIRLMVFHRYPTDAVPMFCGPEANQPRGKVTLADGSVIDDAYACELPNLAALIALLDDAAAPIILHHARGKRALDGGRVLVLEIANEEPR